MQIFLVERTDDVGYDEYTGFVCVAENEAAARAMKPHTDGWGWNGPFDPPVDITFIGIPQNPTSGFILKSFNAG